MNQNSTGFAIKSLSYISFWIYFNIPSPLIPPPPYPLPSVLECKSSGNSTDHHKSQMEGVITIKVADD